MVQKDLRIDLDDFKRVLCNQTDLVVNEMDEDFRVYDFLTKCIGSDVSYPSDHGSYTDLSVFVLYPCYPCSSLPGCTQRGLSDNRRAGRGRQSDRETAVVICWDCQLLHNWKKLSYGKSSSEVAEAEILTLLQLWGTENLGCHQDASGARLTDLEIQREAAVVCNGAQQVGRVSS